MGHYTIELTIYKPLYDIVLDKEPNCIALEGLRTPRHHTVVVLLASALCPLTSTFSLLISAHFLLISPHYQRSFFITELP